jgi:hypothetical protein
VPAPSTAKYHSSDNRKIEIENPGGLHGNPGPENFPNVSDYRNPIITALLLKKVDWRGCIPVGFYG